LLIRISVVFLLGTACLASAQAPNPGFVPPDTKLNQSGSPAPSQTNNTDKLFLQLALSGNSAELSLAEKAKKYARSDRMKSFVLRMKNDHGPMADKLKELASAVKLPPPAVQPAPTPVDSEAAYWQSQIIDHQKMVQLLSWEIGSGEYVELQSYAQQMLPVILQHLDQARQGQQEYLTKQGGVKRSDQNNQQMAPEPE